MVRSGPCRHDATWVNWRRKRRIYREARISAVTPSRWQMSRLERSMLMPAVSGRRVIPNGVDQTAFPPGDRLLARQALGLPPDARLAVMVSNLGRDPRVPGAWVVGHVGSLDNPRAAGVVLGPMERSRSPAPDLAAAAARAVDTARDCFGVRRAALFWREAGSDGLTCIASAGEGGADRWLGHTLPAGVGMAGRAVVEGRPVWSPDLLADARVPLAPWLRERLEREGLRCVAAAPVRVAGVVRGALGLLDGAGRTFDDAGLSQFARLADDVGSALERVIRPPR